MFLYALMLIAVDDTKHGFVFIVTGSNISEELRLAKEMMQKVRICVCDYLLRKPKRCDDGLYVDPRMFACC